MPRRRKSNINGTSRAAADKTRRASESPSETNDRHRMSENQRVRLSSESPVESPCGDFIVKFQTTTCLIKHGHELILFLITVMLNGVIKCDHITLHDGGWV